jgi:hypothetical protein
LAAAVRGGSATTTPDGRGLAMRFVFLSRLVTLASLAACALAVAVARLAPRPTEFRVRDDPYRVVVNGTIVSMRDVRPRVLDAEGGRLSVLNLPNGESLEWGAFSPWVGSGGEWQVVGRWLATRAVGGGRALTGSGLARVAYPSGRVLERVTSAPLPISPPSWDPSGAPRVLYAATDGRLALCTFRASGGPDITPVVWRTPPRSLGRFRFEAVAWPSARPLQGYVIATVLPEEPRGGYGPSRLWWLRLSRDGTTVLGSGPLVARTPDAAGATDESTPSVAARGETCLLAYQRRRDEDAPAELVVAPVRVDDRTDAPAVAPEECRALGNVVARVPAAFAPGATSVYALEGRAGADPVVRRFAVERIPD